MANQPGFQIEELPIFCYYDQQRFKQFGSMDCANWYGIKVDSGKKQNALYPAMGRQHVHFLNENRLIFTEEPRAIFKSINYIYVVVGTSVFRFDTFYNEIQLSINVASGTGDIWFDTLPVQNIVYNLMTDGVNIFLITENADGTVTAAVVTDPNAPGGSSNPGKPTYVAAFGNRFVVSSKGSNQFYLSATNMVGGTATGFTVNGAPIFASASGVIGQFGVLHNQLYIFCDFVTDVWSNIITQITVGNVVREFPWKLNTSYNFDYGIADPHSLAIDFGMMAWLCQNAAGLVSFMVTNGQAPQDISTQAIDVLLQNSANNENLNPFLFNEVDAFLYQYENTQFYRASVGTFMGFGELDVIDNVNAVEFNFDTKTWSRVIELNGERNRIKKHVYFNNSHLVTVQDDPAMYQMAGNLYFNETINPAQSNHQAADAFLKFPMRYELVTQQIYLPDYSEFKDDYVEIDFVFGNQSFFRSTAPFLNTQFIIKEDSTPTTPPRPIYMITEDDKFIITEQGNTPQFDDNHYFALFKPYIELYYSDDGGETFYPADLREWSPLGMYRWRMRWYELATSRNRCYRLVCVSSAPIVILGGVRNTMRISGGAN